MEDCLSLIIIIIRVNIFVVFIVDKFTQDKDRCMKEEDMNDLIRFASFFF